MNPVQIGDSTPLSMEELINDPIAVREYLKTLPAQKELTMTIKIIVNDSNVSASVQWNSSHSADMLRYTSKETQQEFYEQEHFNIRGEICPIIELEENIVRKVSSFFDHKLPIITIRTHKEMRDEKERK